jgi:hypothetical protein
MRVEVVYRKQLDLETLVATRGAELPTLKAGGTVDVPSLRESKDNGRL